MKRMKLLRIESGFSQIELAELSKIPRYLIQAFEQGIRLPSKEEFEQLAEALGVDAQELTPKRKSTDDRHKS